MGKGRGDEWVLSNGGCRESLIADPLGTGIRVKRVQHEVRKFEGEHVSFRRKNKVGSVRVEKVLFIEEEEKILKENSGKQLHVSQTSFITFTRKHAP
jgi:hypothetical protein